MRHFRFSAAVTAALAVALTAAAASATPTGSVTFGPGSTCTTGSTTFAASISVYPANAFNPLFVQNVDTGQFAGVLVPLTVVLNGDTLAAGGGGALNTSALSGQMTTCTFVTSRGTFDVTGILAPPM